MASIDVRLSGFSHSRSATKLRRIAVMATLALCSAFWALVGLIFF